MATGLVRVLKPWRLITSIDLPVSEERTTYLFPQGIRDVLVDAGSKNVTQAYGGMTVFFPNAPGLISAPKFIPIYNGYDAATTLLGILFVFMNGNQLELQNRSGKTTLYTKVWGR